MTVINYPALRFRRELVNVVGSSQDLSRATRLGLKGGWLDNQLIVDSQGNAIKAIGARKVRMLPPKPHVGAILEFVSGNPTYEVELLFDAEPTRMSLEEVKRLVFSSFRHDTGWRSTLDFPELRRQVLDATSISEIIDLLRNGPR